MAGLHFPCAAPTRLLRARLPRWLLPVLWPSDATGRPVLACLTLAAGQIEHLAPMSPETSPADPADWDLAGAPVLPGLVDAHTHLDKTFTLERIGHVKPGLLAAIDAMMGDRAHWTREDIHARASQALQWAWEAGVTRIRSHVDWWEPAQEPLAWSVLGELAQAWAGRIQLERAALVPQTAFEDAAQARRLARHIAASGPGALLGGFIHSHHWTPSSARQLLLAAQVVLHGPLLELDQDVSNFWMRHHQPALTFLMRAVSWLHQTVVMLVAAAVQHDIALERSFMVGDRASDIAAGRAAGCKTIFVDLDYTAEPKPDDADFSVRSLRDATACILEVNRNEARHVAT